jgi:hypothetical protein
VFIGDAMEERASDLFDAAKKLGDLKIPCFLFQEGADPEVRGCLRRSPA